MRLLKTLSVLALFLFTLPVQSAEKSAEVRVAVAANFVAPLEAIIKNYNLSNPDKIVTTSGASGKFFAQIENGAPFDLFLSADQTLPKKLVDKKLAESNSEFTYAVGRLVLWSADPKLIDNKGSILHTDQFKHLAVANPELAPYGKAAEETLKKLNLYDRLKAKFVTGENIGQTQQFILSGNAELGFIALSMTKEQKTGSSWMVPGDLYSPILQDAVLLNSSKNKKAARKFLDYLKAKEAKKIIEDYGYSLQK